MHITIGTDTKTPETPPHLKEGGGQITPNRFDPYIFNANCQTDRELLENYFRKDACDAETVTLREIKKPEVRCTMLQTEDTPANPFGDEEPVPIGPLPAETAIPNTFLLEKPEEEIIPETGISPQHTFVEDFERDWVNSPLWTLVS